MKYNKKIVDEHELIYSSDWINNIESISHWSYYWHQANLVEKYFERKDKILEIGIGTGFLRNYLRSRGQIVQSLDIDPDKKPDICAEASGFSYSSLNLDGVLAFEVFEHMPIQLLNKLIQQLYNSKVSKLLFSVPWNDVNLASLVVKIPFAPKVAINIKIPRLKVSTPAHFYELSLINRKIGKKELITEAKFKDIFFSNGYECQKLNRVDNIQFYLAIRKEL